MDNRWVMLSLLWLLYAAFGLTSRAMAPLVTPILSDLKLSYTQMGVILGSWQFAYILVALVAGTLIDRWGVRKSLMLGTVLIALSSALRYFPKGFEGMLGAMTLLGAGGSLISIGCPKAISLWFEGKSRGTVVGIYLTGSWIGGIVALTLTNSFVMPLTSYSWRATFFLYGVLTFVVSLLWWFLARESRAWTEKEDEGILEVFARLIRIRNVQVVIIMGLVTFTIIHGFNNWLPKILETNGLSPVSAGFTASIPLAAGLLPLLIVPPLIPPRLRGRFLSFSALLFLAALWLIMTSSGIIQLVGLTLFGATVIPLVSIQTLILMDTPEVGSRYMGSAGGIYFCISEIRGFTGPFIMGFLVDITGTFGASGFFLAAMSLTIFVLGLVLKAQTSERES